MMEIMSREEMIISALVELVKDKEAKIVILEAKIVSCTAKIVELEDILDSYNQGEYIKNSKK